MLDAKVALIYATGERNNFRLLWHEAAGKVYPDIGCADHRAAVLGETQDSGTASR